GVHVYGASSMGALRAAELSAFGMRGVGQVFEALASGELEDDDEVAVAHAPASRGFQPLSEAMVNLRVGLRRAEREGIISTATHEALLPLVKAQFYPERSWASVMSLGEAAGLPRSELRALVHFARTKQPNAKREDAVALLELIGAELEQARRSPHRPNFTFESSVFWERTRENMASHGVSDADERVHRISREAVRTHVRLTDSKFRELQRSALLDVLAAREAARMEIEVDEARVRREAERFRRARRLLRADEARSFLESNHVSKEEFSDAMQREALVQALTERFDEELGASIERELKLQGRFGVALEELAQKLDGVGETGLRHPAPSDLNIDEDALVTWYQARYQPILGSLDVHAVEAGFASRRELVNEILALYLAERFARSGRNKVKADERADFAGPLSERPE
ncbi:MAG TPA: TfuA domain-containing protein, partial [Polyangiaceae bacterium]|nr:TfuA domain-containing protein [Polyangiaceae bacterium]